MAASESCADRGRGSAANLPDWEESPSWPATPGLGSNRGSTAQSRPGPHLDYSFGSVLLNGRRGSGPLLIAIDTNHVVDYFQHSGEIWRGLPYDGVSDPEYIGDLDNLSLILALHVVRDIRLIVLPETLRDAKKTLSAERYRVSRVAFDQFTNTMEHFADSDDSFDTSRRQTLCFPDSIVNDALARIPHALDRMMVRAVMNTGAHVFMTRDRRVINCGVHFRPLGLFIASHGDV